MTFKVTPVILHGVVSPEGWGVGGRNMGVLTSCGRPNSIPPTEPPNPKPQAPSAKPQTQDPKSSFEVLGLYWHSPESRDRWHQYRKLTKKLVLLAGADAMLLTSCGAPNRFPPTFTPSIAPGPS